MKWLIASDLHGDAQAAERLMEAFHREGAARIVLLGDLLNQFAIHKARTSLDIEGAKSNNRWISFLPGFFILKVPAVLLIDDLPVDHFMEFYPAVTLIQMAAEWKDKIIDADLPIICITVHIWLLKCKVFGIGYRKTLHLLYQIYGGVSEVPNIYGDNLRTVCPFSKHYLCVSSSKIIVI